MALSEHRPGIFFILVAPAGAGKNRLMEAVTTRLDHLRQLPTATTRPIRANEQQGREHVFVTMEEFNRFIEMGALLEYQLVHGVHYYGILREKVEAALYSGESVIADIELKGARAARAAYPDNVVTIFIQPPSISALVDRMRVRKENDAEIARRLMRVPMEMEFAREADYIIVNDDLEAATESLFAIITAERRRTLRHQRSDDLQYEYVARVVPTLNSEALRRRASHQFPEAVLNEGEPPHVAAARALNQAFGAALPAGKWVYGKTSEDGFLPPVALTTDRAEGRDRIIFLYPYQLLDRPSLGESWEWTATPAEIVTEQATP